MIDLSMVVNANEFAQPYQIVRSNGGSYVDGVWTPNTETVQGFGTITPATPKQIEMLPEGDVVTSAMAFHSEAPIFTTRENGEDGQPGSSDILVWRGKNLRVLQVLEYSDYGYFLAIATRMDMGS